MIFSGLWRQLCAVALLSGGIVLGSVGPGQAADEAAARQLVQVSFDDVMRHFSGRKVPPAERTGELRRMIASYGDPVQSAQMILGKNWTKATAEEQASFLQELLTYVCTVWGGQLTDLSPKNRLVLATTRQDDNRVLLHATVYDEDNDPTMLEVLVGDAPDGHPVLLDVTMDGVSLIGTMRADFTAVLRSRGYQMAALLAAMQSKIDQLSQ